MPPNARLPERNPITVDAYMQSTRKLLNTVLKTDWEAILHCIKDAIVSDNLNEMDNLLYRTALRKMYLLPKSVLDIARKYPQELDNAAFRKACQIACGLSADAIPSNTTTVDPVFNPAVLLASYYRARSEEATAAHAESPNQSGRLGEPDPRPEPAGSDPDLRHWNDVSTKWMLTYDLKTAIEAGLVRTKLLNDAIEAYERSRRPGS